MVTIRQVLSSEWQKLQHLNNEVFIDNAEYDSDLVENWAYSEQGEAYFKDLVTDTDSICFVAVSSEKVVGYIAASFKEFSYRKSKYLEIDNMGVSPDFRSQGVGKKLMETCLQWGREHGYQKAFVNSYAANVRAIHFYKLNGFSEIDISLEKDL